MLEAKKKYFFYYKLVYFKVKIFEKKTLFFLNIYSKKIKLLKSSPFQMIFFCRLVQSTKLNAANLLNSKMIMVCLFTTLTVSHSRTVAREVCSNELVYIRWYFVFNPQFFTTHVLLKFEICAVKINSQEFNYCAKLT